MKLSLFTTLPMTSAGSIAMVYKDGHGNTPVTSVTAKEIIRMSKRPGRIVIHSVKYRTRDGEIYTKEYVFKKSYIENFIKKHIPFPENCFLPTWAELKRRQN